MEFHPAAEIFPLLQGEEYESLKADIRDRGQREPIILCDGMILDGRNRYRACMDLGIEPATKQYTEDDPIGFSVSLNLRRRHLTATERAVAGEKLLPLLEAEAKERQATSTGGANPQLTEKIPEAEKGEARQKAAEMVGTNERYISDVKKIHLDYPDLYTELELGAKDLQQAKRAVKERGREARRQRNRQKVQQVAAPVVGETKFTTLLIDPPWDWSDEGDVDQLGRAQPDYATLTHPQLLELPVGELADVDAHLYLWITNRSLPKGFSLLERWGFRYITCITWFKPSFGMGNYFRGQTEHLLFGVRGSLPLKRKDAATAFHADRGPDGHSSKPDAAYDLIESCSPGPYLEMFARRGRPDWSAWGEGGHAT